MSVTIRTYDGAAARLEEVKSLIRQMRWQDVEALAELIEYQRNTENVKKCRKIVTGAMLFCACGGGL